MDKPIPPGAFLTVGAVFSLLAAFMLMHATDGGERFLGYASGWLGLVLTVAGSAALGVSAGQQR